MPQCRQDSLYGSVRLGSTSQLLLQLYPDPTLQPGDVISAKGPVVESLDLIAVPGIRQRRDSINYGRWLRHLLPKDFPDSRVLFFSYDALHAFGEARLFQAARHFLDLLVAKRRHDPFRPIIFLAHSVGGIFLKYALVQAWEDQRYRSVRESVRGIIFFGTPHYGFSDDLSMEALVQVIAGRLLVPSPGLSTPPTAANLLHDNDFLGLQQKTSRFRHLEAAATVHERWLMVYRKQLRIVSFYETTPAVVSKLEAVLGLPETDEYVIPLAMSHRNLVRFRSPHDAHYQLARACLSYLMVWARQSAPERGDLGIRELLWFRFLYPEDISSRENRIPDPIDGTCNWIFSNASFKDWMAADGSPLLRITGKPGSGKSTLVRFVQQSLSSPLRVALDRPQLSFLSFFFDYRSPPKSAESVLRLMLHQAVTAQPSLLKFVEKDLKHGRSWPGSLTQSLGSAISHLAKHQNIVILLDGLDEYGDKISRDLVEALSDDDLPASRRAGRRTRSCGCAEIRSSIKFLFTSRYRLHDCDLFSSPANLVDLSSGEAAAGVERDVHSLISWSLRPRSQGTRLAQFGILDQKIMRLVSDITERTAGAFLWTRLTLGAVEQQLGALRDTTGVLIALFNMPEVLQDLYQLLLDSVERDDWQLRALEWVLFADRAMKLEELREALGIELFLPSQLDEPRLDRRRLSSANFDKASGNTDYARIMSPFLMVEGLTVQLIHQSAKDFLMPRLSQRRQLSHETYFSSTNDRLFRCCEATFRVVDEYNQLARDEHPLSSYAATQWYDHFQSRTNVTATQRSKTLHSLCSPRSRLLQIWFPTWLEEKWGQEWELARLPRHPTQGIVLAFLGNEPELESLLQRRVVRAGERTMKGEEWTPLMAAAWCGHVDVVNLLLSWYPSYELHPRLSARALTHAIDRGHTTIVQALTSAFATPTPGPTPMFSCLNAFVNGCGNPLVAATRRGSIEMVNLLIEAGADIHLDRDSTRPGSGWSPLHWAIHQSNDDVVRLLLNRGARLDSHAISLACDCDDSDVVSVVFDELLRDGKGPWESWDAPTLLRFSSKLRDKKFVAELLKSGADPALPDVSGVSALEMATRTGWTDGVQLFYIVEHDKAVDAFALLASCQDADVEMVKLLLELGNLPSSSEPFANRSAIHHVLLPSTRALLKNENQQRRLEVIRLLLRYGVDVNHRDIWGETGLHLASRHREERIAALLVDAGADRGAENCDGETALDLAAQNGDISLISLLLKKGCSVRNATWRNILSSGNAEASKLLFDHWRDNSRKESPQDPDRQPALEPMPFEIAQHFVMCGDAPTRFQQAVKYLRAWHILDSPIFELDFRDRLSFGDVLKTWWEKTTSAKWYWWPLAPPAPFLGPDKAWIRWHCGTGSHQHRAKIPIDLALDIRDLLAYQAEVSSFARTFLRPDHPPAMIISTSGLDSYVYSRGNVLQESFETVCPAEAFDRESSGGLDTASRIRSTLTTWKRAFVGPKRGYKYLPVRTCPASDPGGVELAQRNPPAESVTHGASGSRCRRLENRRVGPGPCGQDPEQDPGPEVPGATPAEGRWVYLKPSKSSNLEFLDVRGLHDLKFCDQLCDKYMARRSFFRRYLSIMRFHHWGFDKFEQTGGGSIRSRSKGSKNDVYLPAEDTDYEFVRVETEDGGAPVSQVVFCGHYWRCARGCRVPRFVHSCNNPPRSRIPRYTETIDDEEAGQSPPPDPIIGQGRVLPYVPKRYEKWAPPDYGFESAYGLTAFELPSFAGVWAYSCLLAMVLAVLWALWLSVFNHPADLQNASVPAAIAVTLWVAGLACFRDKSWNRFEEC